MPAGLASLVLQSQVVLTILASAAVLRERPSRPQVIGVALGSAGLSAFGWKAVASTVYTAALASFVGYGAWNSLLARYPSSQVVPWVLLVPPVGIVSAWLCLGETPGGAELAGGVVLVLGVLVAQGRLRRRPRSRVVEPAAA